MPAQKIGSWLASSELGALYSKARRLAELQQVFFDSAPASLTPASRVKNYRAGTLFLSADNAAVAQKLKQLAPRLLINIRKREPEVTGIQVEVQVKESSDEPRLGPGKHLFGPDIIEKFKKLSDTIPPSTLKSALTNLVQRRRQRHD